MSWIQGYSPNWVLEKAKAEELIDRYSREWIGKSIEASYVGWYTPDDTWYEDMPIVLIVGGEQFEICWQQFDSLSISKNQIDLNNCISYNEAVPYKKNALEALNKCIDKTITAVKLGMSSMTLEDKVIPMINSVDFYMESGFLTIYNALDENAVSNVPANV